MTPQGGLDMQMLLAGSDCHSNHQSPAHENANQPVNNVQVATRAAVRAGARADSAALSPTAVAAEAGGVRGYMAGRATGGFGSAPGIGCLGPTKRIGGKSI